MAVGVRKVESPLAVPGQEQAATLARAITGLPDLDGICRSLEMILYDRQFPADDLKNQLDKLKTRLALSGRTGSARFGKLVRSRCL